MNPYRKLPRRNWYFKVFDTRTNKVYPESAHTEDYEVACQRLAEAERLVTLGVYVPPALRKTIARDQGLSMHTAVAEFLAKMVTDGAGKSYIDWASYLLFNWLEFFEGFERVGDGYQAADDLPKCRLRVARYRKTAVEDLEGLLAPRNSDRPARLVSEPLVEAFKHHMLVVNDADETSVNAGLKALRMFGKWLVRRIDLPRDPFADVKDVVDDGEPAGRALTVPEYASIVAAAEEDFRDWTVTAGLHGLRRGEADHLRAEDIVVEEGYFHLRRHRDSKGEILWQPKFGRERRVPFAESFTPMARKLRDLPTDDFGHVLGVHDRRKARDRALAKAGVAGRVRLHDFRHTAYTHIKAAAVQRLDPEVALADIRRVFGHSTGTMDDVYDHRTVDRLRRLVELNPMIEAVVEYMRVA